MEPNITNNPVVNIITAEGGIPLTGWKCAICFENAQVWMIDVCLCEEHARRYNFGYGEILRKMREEYDEKMPSVSK